MKVLNTKYGYYFLLALLIVFITGCSETHQSIVFRPGYDTQYYREVQAQTYIQKLTDDGIGVIQVGETIRIIMPAQLLFNDNSANLRNSSQKLLITVAKLLKQYQIVAMQIKGYANTQATMNLNWALSKRQAEVIENFLWSQGLDTRFVVAIGCKNDQPLLNPSSAKINNRVEIKFRYVPMDLSIQ